MKTSPTQRSKAKLKAGGYDVGVTEHWNPHAFIRQDLFGCIDMLAIKSGEPIIAVQTTSTDVASRRTKILAEPRMKVWLETGNRLLIHGWRKRGARGKRKLWDCRDVEITLEDFSTTAVSERALETTEPFL